MIVANGLIQNRDNNLTGSPQSPLQQLNAGVHSNFAIFTVRNSSCGKVILSQVSVCPGGGVHPLGRHPPGKHPPGRHPPWADTPWADNPAWADTPLGRHPRQTPPTPRDGHCSRRYTFYWNAFLSFSMKIKEFKNSRNLTIKNLLH